MICRLITQLKSPPTPRGTLGSVQEYLQSSRLDSDVALDFQECHAGAAIAKVCLSYLLQFKGEVPSEEIVQHFPFVDYAARAQDTDNRTLQLIEQLFCFSGNAYKVCYDLYRPDQTRNYFARQPVAPALYYAALGGLLHTVKCLSDRGADVNAQGGTYGNALHAASSGGHEQIVRLLVEKGADVNAQGGEDGNALQAASSEGHE